MASEPPDRLSPPPTVWQLFAGFLTISLCGFGGVLPWARWALVDRKRWLDPLEFADILALCQFLPGPNIVNVSVVIGAQFRGLPGAVAALSGLALAPAMLVIGLGALYARYAGAAVLVGLFKAVAAAAASHVIALTLKLAEPLLRDLPMVGFALIAFIGIAILRWPLPLVLLALAPLSVAAALWRPR